MAGPPANAARVGIAQARVSAACPLLGSLVPSLRGPDFCISRELSLPPCLVSWVGCCPLPPRHGLAWGLHLDHQSEEDPTLSCT